MNEKIRMKENDIQKLYIKIKIMKMTSKNQENI